MAGHCRNMRPSALTHYPIGYLSSVVMTTPQTRHSKLRNSGRLATLGTVLASRIGFPQLGQCGTLGLSRGASIACLVARNGVWSFDLDQAQHPQREIRTARLSAFYGRGLRLIATGTREAAPEGAFAPMAAGLSDRLWPMEDIAALVGAAAPKPRKRGPYKKHEAA